MAKNYAPQALLRDMLERRLIQGNFDEAAELALRVLSHEKLHGRDDTSSAMGTLSRRELAGMKLAARRLGLKEEFSALAPKLRRALPDQESRPEINPTAVVELAIEQHVLAGRLPEATALAIRLGPYRKACMEEKGPSKLDAVYGELTGDERELFRRLLETLS